MFKFNDKIENLSVSAKHRNRIGRFVRAYKKTSLVAIPEKLLSGEHKFRFVHVKTTNLRKIEEPTTKPEGE